MYIAAGKLANYSYEYLLIITGVRSNPEERGVIPNSFEHIFTHIDRTENEKYLVRVSYLEIYQEEVRDLLSKDHKRRLDVREKPDTGVYVKVNVTVMSLKSGRVVPHHS